MNSAAGCWHALHVLAINIAIHESIRYTQHYLPKKVFQRRDFRMTTGNYGNIITGLMRAFTKTIS